MNTHIDFNKIASKMADQHNARLSQGNNLQAENEALRRRIAELEAAKQKPIRFKVTEKGGMSVYGLGRFPTTLYKSQWKRLLSVIGEIEVFLAEHDGELTNKAD